MNASLARRGLQLRSLITPDGELELSLVEVDVPAPQADEVVVRVEASPLNPSDQGLMFGPADLATARAAGTPEHPVVVARIPPERLAAVAGRLGQSMPIGNEGAGVVIEAGASPEAQALLGRTVALFGGAMFSQFRCVKASQCMALPAGTAPADGASCFVNPLTALGMVETMRREGHRAMVHTAAASNLGQMLNRICQADGIPLVNVVRGEAQADLLKGMGATHVCVSSRPSFLHDLTEAIAATGATLAFDATGGGPLAGQILGCMEAVLVRGMKDVQPLRLDGAQAGLPLRRAGPEPDRAAAQLRLRLLGVGLAAVAVPAEDRPGRRGAAARAHRRRAAHHVREPLRRRNCRSPRCCGWTRSPRTRSAGLARRCWSIRTRARRRSDVVPAAEKCAAT